MTLRHGLSLVLLLSLLAPLPLQAAYYDYQTGQYRSPRRVRETSRLIRKLELRERQQGLRRSRTSDASYLRYGRSLRQSSVRYLRRSPTQKGQTDRSRRLRTPYLRQRSRPKQSARASQYGTDTVSRETQVFYLNGIKHAKGDGVRRDWVLAYMWFKFALSDGHPLARKALDTLTRWMPQSDIQEAESLAKYMSVEALRYSDDRPERIRDELRKRDLENVLHAIERFEYYHNGRLPEQLLELTEKEICRMYAKTCLEHVDLRFLIPAYLLRIPEDPWLEQDDNGTGYFIARDELGLILYAEGELSTIVVTQEE